MKKNKYPMILGMIQPEPCPGSFQNKGMHIDEITEKALEEAEILNKCGFDGYIIQNRNDAPIRQHADSQNIAYMTVIAKAIKTAFPEMIQGILINWDGVASLAVADAVGSDFVRVEHTYTGVEIGYAGWMEAQCVEICEFRKKIGSSVPVFADIHEIHYAQVGAKSNKECARDMIQNAFADGIFIGGTNTKSSIDFAKEVREVVGPKVPIFLSSGATGDNIEELLTVFDGVSVGTWIKNGNMRNPIDQNKAKSFIKKAKKKSRTETGVKK